MTLLFKTQLPDRAKRSQALVVSKRLGCTRHAWMSVSRSDALEQTSTQHVLLAQHPSLQKPSPPPPRSEATKVHKAPQQVEETDIDARPTVIRAACKYVVRRLSS